MDSLFKALTTIPDSRRGNHLIYPLDYILLVVFTAVMAGFNAWSEVELYAQIYEQDLKRLYKRLSGRTLSHYTPSHDTFAYVFRGLDPTRFQVAFKKWLTGVFSLLGQHISIDGKTMRGVKNLELNSECHTVSAYIKGLRVTLDQVFISDKSNEINAIKELLDLIDINDSVVTIDAIGTQHSIAKKIVAKGGNYVFNVKANQSGTLLELEEHFKPAYKAHIIKTSSLEQGHGRVEERAMESIVDLSQFKDLELYKDLDKWQDIQSIHKLKRVRYDKKTEKESVQIAYFISSLTDPNEVFSLIRDHWAVENNLHYCLDVILGEDQSLKRKDNEAKNWNIINKIALFFLEKQKEKTKIPIKNLRKRNATMKPSQILEYDYL